MKFSFFKKKNFFTPEEQWKIVAAIREAERQTSGEIRLYAENRCRYVNPLDRAAELFYQLKMDATQNHNAVLLYIATKDRQLAVFGDKGIHEKVGESFWNAEVKKILSHFNKENYVEGLESMILKIGEALGTHFPYNKENDINELPDDIVFGK